MAGFIAWFGIALGLFTGIGFAILWFRRSPPQGPALFITGEGAEAHDLTPREPGEAGQGESRGESNTEATKTEPAPADEPTAGEPSPQKSPPRSLADRLRITTGLQGTLSQVPPHEFLQFLAQGKRSGVLEIVSGRRHGYARFSEGRIAHASFRGRHGLEALYALLPLAEGDFEFIEGAEASVPGYAEGGAHHPPLDVVDVLFQWDIRRKEDGETGGNR